MGPINMSLVILLAFGLAQVGCSQSAHGPAGATPNAFSDQTALMGQHGRKVVVSGIAGCRGKGGDYLRLQDGSDLPVDCHWDDAVIGTHQTVLGRVIISPPSGMTAMSERQAAYHPRPTVSMTECRVVGQASGSGR
jgi:hypothetical protein